MGKKLRVERQQIDRVRHVQSAPAAQKSSVGVVGLLGWLLMLVAAGGLAFVAMTGKQALTAERAAQQERLRERQLAFAAAETENERLFSAYEMTLDGQAEELKTITERINQRRRQNAILEKRHERLAREIAMYEANFTQLRQQLDCSHDSLQALVAAYESRQSGAAARAEPRPSRQVQPVNRMRFADNVIVESVVEPAPPASENASSAPRPDGKEIDLDTRVTRDKRTGHGKLTVSIRNGDFDATYSGVRLRAVITGKSTSSGPNRYNVMMVQDVDLVLPPRTEKNVLDTSFDLRRPFGYPYVWYEYHGYAILFFDQDGKVVATDTTYSYQERATESLITAKVGDAISYDTDFR